MENVGEREVTLASSLAGLRRAYEGTRVLVTGHTGFKGSWLTLWLQDLGAEVFGYALAPPTNPSLFDLTGVAKFCRHELGDVCDTVALRKRIRESRPEVVFHLAAQSLVRVSYREPLETIKTNVLGTASLLEAVRAEGKACSVVVVTSDKCYQNREWVYGYRETDPLGGYDVYSASKSAAELLTAAYRSSFFRPAGLAEHGVGIATARAGNVIGGGDWARDRIVPDAVTALAEGRAVVVRNPKAVRPWQHVLEPLGGYLLLGARLRAGAQTGGGPLCDAWNFGPAPADSRSVADLVELLIAKWGDGSWTEGREAAPAHEAGFLRLAVDKAWNGLGWTPRWSLERAVTATVDWYRAFYSNGTTEQLRLLSLKQIAEYVGSGRDG